MLTYLLLGLQVEPTTTFVTGVQPFHRIKLYKLLKSTPILHNKLLPFKSTFNNIFVSDSQFNVRGQQNKPPVAEEVVSVFIAFEEA